MMHTSIVKVYNTRLGKWEKGALVTLSWDGIANFGTSPGDKGIMDWLGELGWDGIDMNPEVYTDANGVAVIEHSSSGEATIYVNGQAVKKMDTPGSEVVEI